MQSVLLLHSPSSKQSVSGVTERYTVVLFPPTGKLYFSINHGRGGVFTTLGLVAWPIHGHCAVSFFFCNLRFGSNIMNYLRNYDFTVFFCVEAQLLSDLLEGNPDQLGGIVLILSYIN